MTQVELASQSLRRPDSRSDPIDRRGFFLGLAVLAAANGLCGAVVAAINRSGWWDALFNTFDVSAIVWLSCAAGVGLLAADAPTQRLTQVEKGVGFGCLLLIFLPTGPTSWLALTILCGFLLSRPGLSAAQRRGALILLATTLTMLWSRLLFQAFASPILTADATLVGWLVGSPRIGNMVQFVHGQGYLVIFPACSSLANMSLAVLCWVALAQVVGHRWSRMDLLWSALACVVVVAINVTRMSLMAVSLDNYEAIHGNLGELISNILFLSAVMGVCLIGVRHELFRPV